MAHTPGEFEVVDVRHQKNGHIRIFSPRALIATVLRTGPNPLDDARLFAAAPKLLAYLERAEKFLGANEPTTFEQKDELATLMREIPELIAELRDRPETGG